MGGVCRPIASNYCNSDEELVRNAQRGNILSAEQLLARYRPLVENKARSYFLLGADHDDVVQEGMIGLFKAIRDYRDDRLSRFRAFADLCVTRQIITAVKSAMRQKHLPLNAYISLYQCPGTDYGADGILLDCIADSGYGDPALALFQQRDAAYRLEAARQALSPLESRVLECYLEGKSYREMSAELRCQPKTVDNALQRVKRKLGDALSAS
jgi:RNA polymerase sporulation-specific sigma factor